MAKVFGYDSNAPQRGEIEAANVEAWEVKHFGADSLKARFGWEVCSTSFKEEKASLLKQMQKECRYPELIEDVKNTKAADVPVIALSGVYSA
ncbi:hypothetical protein SAMN03080615_00860 [Amphritea atlantica]|uniref:Uncharacterized protein n=1 Tax=Amphritea atlantica TaxID=355243 RepID=A0A1H9EER6_9GAMM|nr:hypothetical protein SAMN03080615_00860 [Amphritea atlantica]